MPEFPFDLDFDLFANNIRSTGPIGDDHGTPPPNFWKWCWSYRVVSALRCCSLEDRFRPMYWRPCDWDASPRWQSQTGESAGSWWVTFSADSSPGPQNSKSAIRWSRRHHRFSSLWKPERVSHTLRTLSMDESTTILFVDGVGAFDLISRKAMLQGFAEMPGGLGVAFCADVPRQSIKVPLGGGRARGTSVLVHIVKSMNSLTKSLKRMVTEMQWLCRRRMSITKLQDDLWWIVIHQNHDNGVVYCQMWSRRSCCQSYGRKQTCRNQPDLYKKTQKAVVRHGNIRDQNPLLRVFCTNGPHQRRPNAPKFEDRSQEETECQEQSAREATSK